MIDLVDAVVVLVLVLVLVLVFLAFRVVLKIVVLVICSSSSAAANDFCLNFSKLHLRGNGPSVPLRREQKWVKLESISQKPKRGGIQLLSCRQASADVSRCYFFFKPSEWEGA